jgi:protein TonB
MVKSFYTHLSTIFLLHGLILMGTWQLSQSDAVKNELTKLGNGVIKLQIASKMMMASSSSEAVQKKSVRALPVNPSKPSTTPKKEEVSLPVSQTNTASQGTGAGSEFGTSMNGKTDALSIYKAELRAMIDRNKSYPTMSKRLGQTGTVVIGFTLLKDGNIVDVRIEKPSKYDRLNDSALEAVKKVERFKPLPQEVAEGKMDITVPVKFITI